MNIDNYIKNIDIDNDQYIVVGVSAGPDSMALLHMLQKTIKVNIVCAHINHNVRKESKTEEEYLKNYCKENNIIFESTTITSYKKNNFENEAREKRYNFYEKILKKYNSHNLFLAHHGDDLIETVIMKILRGSNLEGYSGIKTCSYVKDYKIQRPLLSLTKKDILNYNKKEKIKYYIDSSNDNTKYTRNRYRKYLLPFLKKEDKDVHLKFLKYSEILQEHNEYINYEIESKINKIYKDNCIYLSELNKEHPFMKKNIIFHILKNIYNNKANIIKEKNILDILNMTTSNKPNYYVNIPKKYIARKEYDYIYIESKNDKINTNYIKKLQKYQNINNIIIEEVKDTFENGNNICRLNSKDIKLPLYIRNKKDGDYIEILGLNGKKKIKDIFIDNKIPVNLRNTYPLLVDSDDNILWIPNIKKSKYNVKKNEFCDIILTSHREGETKNEKEK